MAENQPTVFGGKAVDQLAKAVRDNENRMMLPRGHRGRWQFHGGSIGIRHAVVASVLQGGYYTVTLGTWSGDKSTVCDDIGEDDCNICANLDLESVECGQLLLEYPPSQVTAGDTTVTAYSSTWRLIPLLVGSDCKVINMGDVDADETTAIWQILSGLPEHVIKYTEEWSCCDGEGESGVPTLLTRQATILIGHDCDPVTCDDCEP